jgi:ketosteroid isomerase-like protein
MSTAAVGTMTTQEVANRFNELAQQGNWAQIQEELYADDAESVEPTHSMALQSARGKEALKQKGDTFNSMVEEMHGGYSSAPLVAGNHFAVAMGMDVTMKGQNRSKMDEIALYEVKDGKIVKEQFFY